MHVFDVLLYKVLVEIFRRNVLELEEKHRPKKVQPMVETDWQQGMFYFRHAVFIIKGIKKTPLHFTFYFFP